MGENDSKPRATTRYTVLQQADSVASPAGWVVQATDVEALSDTKAIEQVVSKLGLETGTFIAVPARSWRERTLEVKRDVKVHVV